MTMKPYYEKDGIVLYLGDSRDPSIKQWGACAVVTDPPFGIAYNSGRPGRLPRSIDGDDDTSVRDEVLALYEGNQMLVFGSWRAPRPTNTAMVLIWDTLGANGMGDLSLPWKPSHQEIYVITAKAGQSFKGHRGSDVLHFPPVQSMACNGRVHPHEKPMGLMLELVGKVADGFPIVDPFCGSGTTLIAARELGRKAVGIEIHEPYAEIAARRLDQQLLPFEAEA